MAEEQKSEPQLMTLTEVSNRLDISMPTLQRYKKQHADRIPSEGEGRRQRYPEAALPVFREIYEENLSRRGRGGAAAKKKAKPKTKRRGKGARGRGKAKAARPKAASGREKAAKPSAAAKGGDLLTLTEVAKRTGISYPTLSRYVKREGDRIPHQGSGRRRRYPEAALDAFREIYEESKASRGRKPGRKKAKKGKAAAGRKAAARSGRKGDDGLGQVTRILERLEKRIAAVEKEVKKPFKLEIKRR